MLSRILVPVRGDGMAGTVMGHAAALARQHKAHVAVVHCRTPAADVIPKGVPLPAFARRAALAQADELADRQEVHLRGILSPLARDLGLEVGPPRIGEAATCEMSEHRGTYQEVVRHDGRLADLIVLAKPQRERNIGYSSFKTALYESGRPVLMCPGHGQPTDMRFGRHVAIGWNGSLAASRAVATTLALVQAAETVTVLSGPRPPESGPDVEDLVAYLALRGVAAGTARFEESDPAAGLQAAAKRLGAGLLIVGAYSHTAGSDMLFGGNTQRLVDRAEMPVVLAH